MIKLLASQLPEWARPSHPILQYELSRLQQVGTWRTRFLQILIVAMVLALGGYLYASYIYQSPTQGNITDLAWRALYFPTMLVQIVVCIIALSLGVNSIGQARANHTWDNLRATEVGAEMTLRTRWIAILYRLRAPIIAILLIRIVLLIGILYDVTAYGGIYLEMLTVNLTPEIADWRLGTVFLAFIMTVSVLLPITMIGFSAAIGILISVSIQDRTYSATVQVILIFGYVVGVAGLLIGITQFFLGGLEMTDTALFAWIGSYVAFGDWGLLLMQLGSAGEIWSIVPYGIFLGVILIIFMLVQSAITDALLSLAVRLSERRE